MNEPGIDSETSFGTDASLATRSESIQGRSDLKFYKEAIETCQFQSGKLTEKALKFHFEIGEYLTKAKKECGHGNFEIWAAANVDMKPAWRARHMQLFKKREEYWALRKAGHSPKSFGVDEVLHFINEDKPSRRSRAKTVTIDHIADTNAIGSINDRSTDSANRAYAENNNSVELVNVEAGGSASEPSRDYHDDLAETKVRADKAEQFIKKMGLWDEYCARSESQH